MATGDRNVRHHHRHHHHQYQSAATTTFATLGSTIIGAGNDALAADCRRQVQRSECGRLAATVEVERFVVGDELLELTNLKLSDDPNDNETTSATAAAAEAAATKLNNNRHQHHRTTTSGHHHHNHQPPAPPLLLATTSSAGGGASSSSGSSASGRQQLLEEARAAVRRRTGDGGSGRKMLVAASANDAATGGSPSPASRQAPAERQQQQAAADSGCDHSTDLGAGSSTRAHEQPAFNQSLDSGVGHLSDASSNYSTTTTNANTTNYSHPHQSHHQQQHSNSSAMHQHQQQLVDFGSSGNYAPRNYALDFDSFYPSFSSDPSGQQRLMMSGDPSGSTSGARLVSMDAEFADLTYSSATSGGHFLGLEPASGATSTSERFKVQELGAFELSMVNSTQGQQSDGQQQHQLSHLHHLSYEPPQAASYANLCPAGHYAITDMRPDSVIRLGYQQQQQLDGSETQQQQQHNRDPFQASHVSSQRPTDDEQQQQQPEIQLIEPHDISCLDSHANSAAGPMLLSQTTSSQHQPFSVSQHQASTANHLHLHTSQVSAHASHHQHQHQHQHHPQHHHHHHQHQLDNERELDQGLKVCEWEGCEHTFLDMQEFVKHLEDRHVNQEPREKNRYFCMWSNCKRNEQEFNARYKLLIHMRVHSGEKPYPCNNVNCKKSFSRLENLKIHQRSHTGEKPYKCNFDACSKSFTNSSDRIKHHKTHKDPKPYSCNFTDCTKRYTDPSSLRKHLRAHKRPPTSAGPGAPLPLMQVSGVHSQAQHSQHRLLSADFNPTLLLEPIGSKQQHPRSHLQLPGSNQEMYNQQQQHQHWQLSRSWCAGSTSSSSSMHPTGASFGPPPPLPMNPGQMTHSGGQFSSSRLLADAPATPTYGGQLTDAGASNSHQHHLLHNQHQQRHHSQHLVATHETLMRSMPTQGFGGRRHAHASAAEWPPPARSAANEFRAPYVQPHALQQSLWSDGPQQQQQAHEQEDQHRQAH